MNKIHYDCYSELYQYPFGIILFPTLYKMNSFVCFFSSKAIGEFATDNVRM